MVALEEARRFTITTMVVASIIVALVLVIAMQSLGVYDWTFIEGVERSLGGVGWALIGIGILLSLIVLLLIVVGSVSDTKPQNAIRRVQCGDCSAVFLFDDLGIRPMTVPCPNCKVLGYYDGTLPVRGNPPPAAGKLREIQCPRCATSVKGREGELAQCSGCSYKGRVPST